MEKEENKRQEEAAQKFYLMLVGLRKEDMVDLVASFKHDISAKRAKAREMSVMAAKKVLLRLPQVARGECDCAQQWWQDRKVRRQSMFSSWLDWMLLRKAPCAGPIKPYVWLLRNSDEPDGCHYNILYALVCATHTPEMIALNHYLHSGPREHKLIVRACAHCGKMEDRASGVFLKRCTCCEYIYYCDVNCQRQHYDTHLKETDDVWAESAPANDGPN